MSATHMLSVMAATIGVVFIIWRLTLVFHRLILHPLAKYPGPKIYAATNLPFQWKSNISGSLGREAHSLHKKYGPIVRVAPEHLSIDGSIAWSQIFQHRPGKAEWPKQPDFFFQGDGISLIGGTYENHKRIRRQLSPAFSSQSLQEQEHIIQKYIDLFLSQLSKKAAKKEVIDIVSWYNFTTFDIIGDLTFADGFNSLQSGNYHPWVLGIFKSIRAGGVNRILLQYPFLRPLIRFSSSMAELVEMQIEHGRLANEKAMSRKAQGESPGGRRDFMTHMLNGRNGQPGFSDLDILINSPALVTAGSETTATTLSGLTFLLGLKAYRHIYDTLVEEIRAKFASEAEINIGSTADLVYLTAVIEETLRFYPPAVQTPPRLSPGAEVEGQYIPRGTAVTIFQYATYRNPANFHDPDTMRPERWLPVSHKLYDPVFAHDIKQCFHPFSVGTRDCIGKRLAYAELRVIISRMLHRFDFEVMPGQEDWMDKSRAFLIWEKGPLNVRVRHRGKLQV